MSLLRSAVCSASFLIPCTAQAADFDTLFPHFPELEDQEVMQVLRSFDYQQGEVQLPGGQVTLQVPQGYYYLDPEDAATVLIDLWGNPWGDSMGMIFPAEYTPIDELTWGVEFTWESVGYVSDEDADSYDYSDLLSEMQADTRVESKEREAAGYESVQLVGWAAPPVYDHTERKLHWALELQFGDYELRTLNYNLRALGREGVLNANFIADMDQLDMVQKGLPEVARMISFVEGKRYSDFDPSIDTVAAVGLAGLIAGKTFGKSAGLFALGALLLKKFWFVLLVPLIWLKNFFRRDP